MDERRKHKRLDLDVSVQLERLDQDDITTLKFIHVVVTDISRSGFSLDIFHIWNINFCPSFIIRIINVSMMNI